MTKIVSGESEGNRYKVDEYVTVELLVTPEVLEMSSTIEPITREVKHNLIEIKIRVSEYGKKYQTCLKYLKTKGLTENKPNNIRTTSLKTKQSRESHRKNKSLP